MHSHYVTDHFKYEDCACPCCDNLKITPGFFKHMEMLEDLRRELGFGIVINHGYLCPDYIAQNELPANSWHGLFATDVSPAWEDALDDNMWLERLEAMHLKAMDLGFGGIGQYDTHIHLDLRPGLMRWRG